MTYKNKKNTVCAHPLDDFKMCDTVDVFAGNYTIIDWEIHELWLNGLNSNEAMSFLRDGVVKDFGPNLISQDMLASDVNDHYR